MAEEIKNDGTVRKNIEEREEVTRLKRTFNLVRKWSFWIGFPLAVFILICRYFFTPISNLIHQYTPWELLKPNPWLMSSVWKLFWISFIVWYLTHALKIVQQFEKAAIRSLGKWRRTRKAGPCLMLYPLESIKFEVVAERAIDIKRQIVNSVEGLPFPVDAIIWVKITNLYAALFNVVDWWGSVYNVGLASIRDAASGMSLLDFNKSREDIKKKVIANVRNASTQGGVPAGEVSEIPKRFRKFIGRILRILTFYSQEEKQETGWGIEVTRTEIQEIEIPKEVAESVKNVAVAEQKAKEALELKKVEITTAEGKKQARVLNAEAEAKAIELAADSLKKPGADNFVAMEIAKAIKTGDKIIIENLRDLLSLVKPFFKKPQE